MPNELHKAMGIIQKVIAQSAKVRSNALTVRVQNEEKTVLHSLHDAVDGEPGVAGIEDINLCVNIQAGGGGQNRLVDVGGVGSEAIHTRFLIDERNRSEVVCLVVLVAGAGAAGADADDLCFCSHSFVPPFKLLHFCSFYHFTTHLPFVKPTTKL